MKINGGDESLAILGNTPNETVTIIWVSEHQIHEKTKNGNTMEGHKSKTFFEYSDFLVPHMTGILDIDLLFPLQIKLLHPLLLALSVHYPIERVYKELEDLPVK